VSSLILIVLESKSNIILPFRAKMEQYYPESSRGEIRYRDAADSVLARFTRPPLFNDGWLINCDHRVTAGTLKRLEKAAGKNKILIKVTDRKTLNDVCTNLKELNIRVINNYVLSREDVVNWIAEELGCSMDVANAVYVKTKGRISNVVDAVSTLSALDDITLNSVRRFVKKVDDFGPYDLMLWILGIPRFQRMTKEDSVRILRQYQYGIDWLVKYLVSQIGVYESVFLYALSGELSFANYKHFLQLTNDKVVSSLTEGQLKAVLGSFGVVPLEYVMWLKALLEGIDTKDRLAVYKLMQLIKLGG
jgi:hypothetical protein